MFAFSYQPVETGSSCGGGPGVRGVRSEAAREAPIFDGPAGPGGDRGQLGLTATLEHLGEEVTDVGPEKGHRMLTW